MNCKEIEQDVYLYDELTAIEKRRVDDHMQQCETCKKLFEIAQSHQTILKSIAQHKPQPENHSRLTSSIMQAIDVPTNQNVYTKLFERLFVRYAFLATSLTLTILFVVEQAATTTLSHSVVERTDKLKTVTLKTSGTLQNLRSKREAKPSENITSLYACVKSGDCINPLHKTLN